MKTINELIDHIQTLDNIKYLYFWGHRGSNKKACLSQWYPAKFVDYDFNEYQNTEQYMMAQKALLFNDHTMFNQILRESDPKKVKALGRAIKNFDNAKWDDHKFNIVKNGNILKFSQNDSLNDYLLSTGNDILVEASPYDKIWGIGLNESDAKILSPRRWQGLNLLGFALMEARDQLRN